jgi:hypothetical protein
VEVIGAGLNIANNPAANVSSLFGLVTATAPFQPVLAAVPADLTVGLASSSTTSALTVDLSAVSFPATVVGVPSSLISVTVTNVGTSTAALYGFSIVGINAGDFTQTTNCPGNLASSATCTVQVTFTPLAIGARSAYLSVISSAPNSPQMIPLSGSGIAGSAGPATITPSTLNFLQPGDIGTVTLTNSGATPLSIGAITFSSSNWTQTNNCGSVLDGQSVCTIAVTAGSSIGQFTGALTVIDNDTSDAQTVQLTSDVRKLAVGNTGSTLYIANALVGQESSSPGTGVYGGVYAGTLGGYYFYTYGGSFVGVSASEFNSDTCSTKSSTVCEVFLNDQPTTPGPRSAYFIGTDNSVYLAKGFGLSPTASFTLSPIALNFGNLALGSSTTLNLAVSNSSVVAISLNAPTLSGGAQNDGDFQVTGFGLPSCASPVAASSIYTSYKQGCVIPIRFTPTTIGPRSATMTLTDSTGFTQQVLITGQGTYPAPLINPSQLQFGGVQTGSTSAPQTVTVTLPNHDPAVANIVSSSSPYSLSHNTTCPRLASVCQFSVVFSPTTLGVANDMLLVTDTVTGYSSQIPLSGTGGMPVVSLSSSNLNYSSRSVGVTSVAQPVTITNTGNVALSISVSLIGADPTDFSIVTNTCGNSVAAGSNCALSVSFTPGAIGARTAALQILSNATTSPDSVQLSGTGN